MATAVVFDDAWPGLGPLTDLRPSFCVRTGALLTVERLAIILKAAAATNLNAAWVPTDFAPLAREQVRLPVNDWSALAAEKSILVVNGRCVSPPTEVRALKPSEALTADGAIVAALLTQNDAKRFLDTLTLPPAVKTRETDAAMLHHPWDVIRHRDAALDIDLEALAARKTQPLPPGVIGISDENIHISPDALVYPSVVLDAEAGRIVIDDGAIVRPGAIIIGPAYVGPGSTVIDRALIKPHTAIGPVCKAAGEVGGCIFQGFSNKAHDGHLGDSWVGEWVNFGAGTTNSNLLNTYAEVIAQTEPNAKRIKTGLTFLGCIVGDHVKFAILTRIMTGSVFGTGSMIAAMNPPTSVARFEWLTDDRRQPYRFEKFINVAQTAMSRRKVEITRAYEDRLRKAASLP